VIARNALNLAVIGPFEDLRYTCTAQFQFNQWRCTTPGAPKPQRDRERTDYQTLDRENTLQITPQGWVQAENNVKRTATGLSITAPADARLAPRRRRRGARGGPGVGVGQVLSSNRGLWHHRRDDHVRAGL
jgi:hypothetical protein